MFKIRMGIPGMKKFWDKLLEKKKSDSLDSNEEELFKKLAKTIKFLSNDPKYPSLQSHEIEELSEKYGVFFGHMDQIEKKLQF